MKKEDIEFLRELQHELNTQETDGQAAPRFWGIMETVKRPSPEGFGEPVFYNGDEGLTSTIEEFVQTIEENYLEDNESLKSLWEEIDKSDWDDVKDFANDELELNVEIVYVEDSENISQQTGCFLTKRAAKRYLEQNYYHHENGRTYAMTAWRNPEFERLLNILQSMNIDDIKED